MGRNFNLSRAVRAESDQLLFPQRRDVLAGGASTLAVFSVAASGPAGAANPITPGWFADPEIRIFNGRYWIYATASAPAETPPAGAFSAKQRGLRERQQVWPIYLRQTFLEVFSSPDLVHWTRRSHALDVKDVAWAAMAVWAPSVIEAGGRYHLFFGANDIQNDQQLGGIGVAVSASPGGPFIDEVGHPLIGAFHNGAQPIDPFAFKDDDGTILLYYGGWGRCNVVKLSADLKRVVPLTSDTTYKEITPKGYVEGPFVIKRNSVYYLMWSEGDWTTPDYRVAYAVASSALGPFARAGVILQQDLTVARGAGHHSVVKIPGADDWYIVYHRRPLGDPDGNHRELAIDRLRFNADGTIAPVRMTTEGVQARPLAIARSSP